MKWINYSAAHSQLDSRVCDTRGLCNSRVCIRPCTVVIIGEDEVKNITYDVGWLVN